MKEEKEYLKNRKRKNLIAFWASDEEKEIIKKNAGFLTVGKYARIRALRPDSTNNESVDIIMSFIGKQTDTIMSKINALLNDTIIRKSKEEKAYEIAQLNKPKRTDINFIMDTYKMEEEQREQFIKTKIKAIDETEGLLAELKETLKKRNEEIEN